MRDPALAFNVETERAAAKGRRKGGPGPRQREREREGESEADKKSVAKRRKEERNVCERVLWSMRWRRAKGCANGFQRRNNANAKREREKERKREEMP